MIQVRRASERGATRLPWLDSRHTFSFGEYVDPAHVAFGPLRVINDDRVAPAQGFGTHGHRDMEILTWVLEGELAHRDSLGNGSTIRPGDAQIMSAGTGILHSEMNPSPEVPVHLLQIWILPERTGLPPRYEQCAFDLDAASGRLLELASPTGAGDAVRVFQDVTVLGGRLAPGDRASRPLGRGRRAWLQVARGSVRLGGQALGEGDGVALSDHEQIDLVAETRAEVLLFDLPPG